MDDRHDGYRDADPEEFPGPLSDGSAAVDPGRSDLTSDFDEFYDQVIQ